VTLDRKEVLSAIDGRMLKEIRMALRIARTDPAIRVILIDSSCEKAFSAGIDVAYVGEMNGAEATGVGKELHKTFLGLRTAPFPVVAAIDGLCLGAGLELALSCDFMIATSRSRFGLPNIHRGIPAIVEAAILPLAIGIQGAREMALLGEFWDAQKALRRGLLYAVVDDGAFASEAMTLCRKLAEKSRAALSLQKEIIHKWMTTDLESTIDFSVNSVALAFMTHDQKEGMRAFLEKRKARFEGRP